MEKVLGRVAEGPGMALVVVLACIDIQANQTEQKKGCCSILKRSSLLSCWQQYAMSFIHTAIYGRMEKRDGTKEFPFSAVRSSHIKPSRLFKT